MFQKALASLNRHEKSKHGAVFLYHWISEGIQLSSEKFDIISIASIRFS